MQGCSGACQEHLTLTPQTVSWPRLRLDAPPVSPACARLEELPASIGSCTGLVKIQGSFNRLRGLPASLGRLPKLELCRVAANCITEVRVRSSLAARLAAQLMFPGAAACRAEARWSPAPQHRWRAPPGMRLSQEIFQTDQHCGNP